MRLVTEHVKLEIFDLLGNRKFTFPAAERLSNNVGAAVLTAIANFASLLARSVGLSNKSGKPQSFVGLDESKVDMDAKCFLLALCNL